MLRASTAVTPTLSNAVRPAPPRWWYPALGVGLWLCYLPGGLCLITDAWINVALALSVVEQGDLWLAAEEVPDHFHWRWRASASGAPVEIRRLDPTLLAAQASGDLEAIHDDGKFRDVIVPTPRPGLYASTFCPGAGLTAVPTVAALRAVWPDLRYRTGALWYAAKATAAACVAASAVLVLACAAQWLPPRQALAIALAYGLGTCVWSTSSQTLWQHGPTEMFLMLGVAAWLWAAETDAWLPAALAGLALAAATWCRPTSVLVLACLGLGALVWRRRLFVPLAAAAAPLGLALAWYNYQAFGAPWRFGQTAITNVAQFKTGSAAIWQGTMLHGALGLMFSPSRGLLIFSPFVVFAVWGAVRAHRRAKWQAWRPLAWSVLAVWLVEFNHFDWWGGWSYGYRHIVDTLPLVCLLLVPVAHELFASRGRRRVFAALAAWSVAVQALGAWTYCIGGWNNRPLMAPLPREMQPAGEPPRLVLREANIDLPEFHGRLWSLADSQILYHFTHLPELAALKRQQTLEACQPPTDAMRATHLQIAASLASAGDAAAAVEVLRRAAGLWPAAQRLLDQPPPSGDTPTDDTAWLAACTWPAQPGRPVAAEHRYWFSQVLLHAGQQPAAIEQLALALDAAPGDQRYVAALRQASEQLRASQP